MPTNNYFRVQGKEFFYFNDRSEDDTQRAFDLARAGSQDICVFRPPRMRGPWDRVCVVGHRSRGTILTDLGRTKDPTRRFWLQEELEALDARYYAVGRDTVPFTSVAA